MKKQLRGTFITMVTFAIMAIPSCTVHTDTNTSRLINDRSFDVTVHISDEFSDNERKNIIDGVKVWERSLGDRLTWRAVTIADNVVPNQRNRVVNGTRLMSVVYRRASTVDPLVVEWDEENGKSLLGMCIGDPDDDTLLVWMVESRLTTPTMESLVSAHEFGHALGVEHVDDKKSLMSEDFDSSVRCLSDHDVESFCESRGCLRQLPFRSCVPPTEVKIVAVEHEP